MIRILAIAIAAAIVPSAAPAEPCPGNPQALGTERVLEVDSKTTPRVGRKHFSSTLPLRSRELVLSFDIMHVIAAESRAEKRSFFAAGRG